MKTQRSIRNLAGVATVTALTTGLMAAHAAPHAKISAARANAIALHRFHGYLATKTTLENEEGTWQYGVMVRSGKVLREVMVDANTGKIANVEVTNSSKERVEKKQDEAAAKSKSAGEKPEADERGEHESGAKESAEKGEAKD
ncbi:Peptidase propeptide and YPEB domain-containing protein [Abditibacterium utsteinense]|uniref:Peptidase propeptide and YPEB domain-containing protein n=1 Tax=Abditibacterium utsteinense TaxID=1960156 RepID=A0A2S8SP89_9BACT|nr:PepSY domain-containing protein [Abditibacterium utsteinense]PQV62610.1 Peptidase propeptide and YPEB domain-containing protein [Abditibacterium utsteinense]